MKTSPAVGQIPKMVTHCPDCGAPTSVSDEAYCANSDCLWNNRQSISTPPVENYDTHEVALVGKDGQGVCTLPRDVAVDVAAFHVNSEAFEAVQALYIKGLLPVRAATLIQLALEDRVKLSVACGHLLFLH